MFTGLIQRVGSIQRIQPRSSGTTFVIDLPELWEDLALGESIAVDGACLTVTDFQGTHFSVDVSPETLARSTLGAAVPGRVVNLERALRLSDRLGGHLVTGHVDTVVRLRTSRQRGGFLELMVDAPREVMRLIASKGSVALDGVSLTVNDVTENGFSLVVIPHTQAGTTLGGWGPGRKINLETDLVAKYLERLTERSGTASRLEEWLAGGDGNGLEGR